MEEHPIQGLMTTAMNSIKEMVDVNTIVGDAVQAPDGTVIIPISKVSFGFASGGGEYNTCCHEGGKSDEDEESQTTTKLPFAGGSGAGVSISPVGFMVVGNDQIKLLPVNVNTSIDKVLDLIPELFDKTSEVIKKRMEDKKNTKKDEGNGAPKKVTIITEKEES
ncbi:MAG: GerW family sporulation protein [Bacillota bacterium]|nr:GerW family sporulation protein [Bacillota bacterium]